MIHTYSFYPIDSRMYILMERKKALIIDPCISEETQLTLNENRVTELLVLLTHEHYNHVSGVNWLPGNFPFVQVVCSSKCAEEQWSWEGHSLLLKETPGHSKGSICIILDERYLFSGDSLVTGYPTVTRLPGGSKQEYEAVTLPYLA